MGKNSESGETSCEDQNYKRFEVVSPPLPHIKDEPADTAVITTATTTGTTANAKFHACTHEGCKLTFSRPWRLEAHLRLHKGERPYKCSEEGCSKDYSNNSHLRRHILTAHRSQLFKTRIKCPVPACSMELSDPNSLKRHIVRRHGQKPDCVCLHCNQGFSRRQELADHVMSQHTAVLPFICEVCNAGFTRNRLLKRHMRCHKTYTCLEMKCCKIFDSWNALRRHFKTEHVAKEFGCNECGKSFVHKSRLRTHLWVHQNPLERPIFTCPYEDCDREIHAKIIQCKMWEDLIIAYERPIGRDNRVGNDSFYYHSQNLSQHITSTHQGKLHKCLHPGCHRKLSTKQKLIDHMKLHDPNRKTFGVHREPLAKPREETAAFKRTIPPGISSVQEADALLIQDHFMADHFMANTSLGYSNQVLDLSNKSSNTATTFDTANT